MALDVNIQFPQLTVLLNLGERIMTALADIQAKADALLASNQALQGEAAELRGKVDNLATVAMTTKDALEALKANGASPAEVAAVLATLDAGLAANVVTKATLDAGDTTADGAAAAVAP